MAGAEYSALRKHFPPGLPEARFSSVMDYLQSELGLIFFDKRNLTIATPSPGGLKMVDDKRGFSGRLDRSIKVLNSFLDGQPVGDKFGSNHAHGREQKRAEVFSRLNDEDPELAKAYWAFYSENNQFKLNKLSIVTIRVNTLFELAEENGNNELAARFAEIRDQLEDEIKGVDHHSKKEIKLPYDKIDSLDEKLETVHFFEDKIIEALTLLL